MKKKEHQTTYDYRGFELRVQFDRQIHFNDQKFNQCLRENNLYHSSKVCLHRVPFGPLDVGHAKKEAELLLFLNFSLFVKF
jgi:hypothetical protein